MKNYTVQLDDGTVGTINGQHADVFIGEIVTVELVDDGGNPIEVEGRLVEVLETRDSWN